MIEGSYPPGVTGKDIDRLENKPCCGNRIHFDFRREACSADWNNLDPCYYNPDTDDRKETDSCDRWEEEI